MFAVLQPFLAVIDPNSFGLVFCARAVGSRHQGITFVVIVVVVVVVVLFFSHFMKSKGYKEMDLVFKVN